MAGRLGDILVRGQLITDEQLQIALHSQGSEKGMLGRFSCAAAWSTCSSLAARWRSNSKCPSCRWSRWASIRKSSGCCPKRCCATGRWCRSAVEDGTLRLAMVAPDDIETISETELITGYHVEPAVALQTDVLATLDHGFDERIVARQTIVDMKMADLAAAAAQAQRPKASASRRRQDDAPVVRLVRSILMGAINANVSDIHLEPHTPQMRVRYRVDGELQQVMTIPNHIEEAVVARIKVMAEMDTTETRKPAGRAHLGGRGGRARPACASARFPPSAAKRS